MSRRLIRNHFNELFVDELGEQFSGFIVTPLRRYVEFVQKHCANFVKRDWAFEEFPNTLDCAFEAEIMATLGLQQHGFAGADAGVQDVSPSDKTL